MRAPSRPRTPPCPASSTPCLATLVAKAPDDKRWEHEIKFDGYRIQARLDHGKVKLMTRKGLDWTKKFPSVAVAVGKLRAKTALIDGELVAHDRKGISRFSLLQQDITSGRQGRMVLCAFDLLHLNGADLKALPLYARKAALAKLLRRGHGRALALQQVAARARAGVYSSTPAGRGSRASSRSSPTRTIIPGAGVTG